MLTFNPEKRNCTGCSACYSVCPRQCITMERDEEGFDYPNLTSPGACIDCGLCESVCPINKPFSVGVTQKAYAALSRDSSIWRRSTSGGAFSGICRAWGDEKTLVVGAAWKGFSVHHISILGVDNIAPLCKSKYVSSHIENTFREVREYLKKGKVIFCGTPCQVSGLRAFLRKDFDNLLTIDLICHGVGSPTVFEACLRSISQQSGKELKSYLFRAKRRVHETDYLSKLTFADGEEFVFQDQYIQLYLKQICLRPSCGENCNYRNRNKRPGDFTIADFKGLPAIFPDLLGTKKNYSTIVANSKKALGIIPRLNKQMVMRAVSVEDIIKYNPLFDRQTWSSEERDRFFSEFEKEEDITITKYTKPYSHYTTSFKGRIFNIMPTFLRSIYLRRNKKNSIV